MSNFRQHPQEGGLQVEVDFRSLKTFPAVSHFETTIHRYWVFIQLRHSQSVRPSRLILAAKPIQRYPY